MTLVYLAKPIDFMSNDGSYTYFEDALTGALSGADCSIYDPKRAWDVNGPMTEEIARAIEGVNRQALRRADVIVAWLPEGVQTQGVPAEIEFATRHQGIPAVVIGHVGVALMANPLVSVMPESNVDKVARQVELVLMSRSYSDYRIRYSAPEGVDLAPVHTSDAGIDLPARYGVGIPPGQVRNIQTGVYIELPPGSFGWIVARSSTIQHGVQVLPGIIDQGYQGELKINCLNVSSDSVQVKRGDRLGQLLILHNWLSGFQLTKVDEGDVHPLPTRRGTSGYGSSGT